jgi:putative nucleotidyltransferase with HDIG domain
MRMAAEENIQVEEVARVIETDPSTSARLLKIVNSAYHGLQGRVSSVSRAVVMVGVNGVRNVLLSAQVFDVFGAEATEKHTWLFELWKHCLAVASAAELIAENAGGILPEDAFTAGLLHDLGKIGLYTIARDEYEEIIERVEAEDIEISDAEMEHFGATHSAAGKYIAEKWDLPEAICRAISDHHVLPSQIDMEDQTSFVSSIVMLADDLVRRQRIGFSGTPQSWEPMEELFAIVGLEQKNIDDILDHLVERISMRSSIVDVDLPESELYLESLQKANRMLGSVNEELQQARVTLEHSRKRLEAVTELNNSLGSSFSCEEALEGLTNTVYRHLLSSKVVTYCVDDSEHSVFGSVRNGGASARPFAISARKGAQNNIGGIGADREILIHVVNDLAGKLDPEMGLGALVAGRFMYSPISVGHGQRAGVLVECNRTDPLHADDLRFFSDSAGLFLQRALFENKLRDESRKLIDSNRRSRGFYEQLMNSRKLASIGRMAAGAAHEINNPLAIVSGRVQLLLKMEADESKRHHLDMIRSQCDRMGKIISDILTFGKPDKPAIGAVDVEKVVESAVSLLDDKAAERGVTFLLTMPERLAKIAADEAKLETAFRNILANGLDASEEGGAIHVGAKVDEKGKYVAITFADKGMGMDRETVENIFEPFFTTKAGAGTGLGLSICHSIIASHGGKIRVKSAPGQGTVFTVLLPVWKGV